MDIIKHLICFFNSFERIFDMTYKEKVFFGSATALVTPFDGGEIDYGALGRLIEYQIENKTDALVLLGTTGEAPTISEKEREEKESDEP